MNNEPCAGSRVEPSGHARRGSALPAWWLVFTRELAELWIGGRALNLLILFCIVLGILTYVLASSSQQDPIPPKEMVFYMLGLSIAFGEFIGVIIGADSISGERERATLEPLLLTPTSRRQLVVGKFLAGVSPWPAALTITVPYLAVLSQGDEVLGPALFWGAVLGSLLASAFTGFAMLVSLWSNSNRTSLFMSLTVYLLCLLPTQLQGGAQKGAMGYLLKRVNPMESVNQFIENVLINNRTPAHMSPWLTAPVLFALTVFGVLFWYASPGLRLEQGRASRLWSRHRRQTGAGGHAI